MQFHICIDSIDYKLPPRCLLYSTSPTNDVPCMQNFYEFLGSTRCRQALSLLLLQLVALLPHDLVHGPVHVQSRSAIVDSQFLVMFHVIMC
jgi:hypothetical protein